MLSKINFKNFFLSYLFVIFCLLSCNKKVVDVHEHMGVVALNKMNIFYIGVDNPISCTITGIAAKQLKVSIAGGGNSSILPDSLGGYVVRITSSGKATLTLTGITPQNDTIVRIQEFRCKYIPDPTPVVGGKNGGAISVNEWKSQLGVLLKLDDYDYDWQFEVKSFKMDFVRDGDVVSCTNIGTNFNGFCAKLQQQAMVDDVYFLDDIKALHPDGRLRNLGTIAFKIK